MSVFFIGDLHLGHTNVIKFGQRNFDSIEEHDEHVIKQFNSVVTKKRHLVWILGDVAFTSEALNKVSRLNGTKILIAGNHDRLHVSRYLEYFQDVRAFERRYHGMAMTHIPIHPNEMVYRWKINVHGHLHEYDIDDPRYVNVNFDRIGGVPVHLDTIKEKCKDYLL